MANEKVVSCISGFLGGTFWGDWAGGPNLSTPNFNGVLKGEFAFHEEVKGNSIDNTFG